MRLRTHFMISALVVAFAGWFAYTPYLTVNRMKAAAEAGDAARVSDYVNFPALKENIKGTLNAKLMSAASKDKPRSRFEELGAALATAMTGQLVDALITPESLAAMMKGERPKPGSTPSAQRSQDDAVETSMRYETFDRFVVTAKKKVSPEQPMALVFTRDGLFAWKLSALRFPE